MEKITGKVVATHAKSQIFKKPILEIALDEKDPRLLRWQNRRVIITIIRNKN